jgi:DNA-binding transcriptional ArsR family regulator
MKKIVGNSQYQKVANALLILQLLRKGPKARVAIAKELGLQPSTVTYNINRLQEAGLVRECSVVALKIEPVSLGRRAVALELNRDFGRVIGLELLADSIWASLIDPVGSVVFSEQIEFPLLNTADAKQRFEELVQTVVAQLVGLCAGIPVLGVGIALPGIVETNGQVVRDCWTHQLKDCDFSAFFAETFPFPVVLENDANCCVQRYLYEGAAERQDNFLYLLARTYPSGHVPSGVSPFGIGLGLVFGGRLYRGSDSRSGEFISALMNRSEQGRQLAAGCKRKEDLEHDAAIRTAILDELVGNLRSIASVLDPQIIYLGGFLTDYCTEVQPLLSSDLAGKVVFANAHNDASEGAAVNLLSLFFRIPQVGDTSNQGWRYSTVLRSVLEKESL